MADEPKKKEKLEIEGDFISDSDVQFELRESHFNYEVHQVLERQHLLRTTQPDRKVDPPRQNPFVRLDPGIGITRKGNVTLGALEVEEYYPNGKEEPDMELEVDRRPVQSPLEYKRQFSTRVIFD